MKLSIKDFFSKCDRNVAIFTEKFLTGKLRFCAVNVSLYFVTFTTKHKKTLK